MIYEMTIKVRFDLPDSMSIPEANGVLSYVLNMVTERVDKQNFVQSVEHETKKVED